MNTIEITEAASPEEEIIVICNTGGSLESSINFSTGKQSRSLMAAYEMLGLGYTNLKFLDGGYNQWIIEERDIMVYE